MKLKRFDHIVITTACEEECIRFYTRILDMTMDSRGGRLAFTFGNQKINVHRRKGEFLPAAHCVTYGSADICLIAQGDIHEIKAELEEKGWPVELGVVERNGSCGPMDSVYIRDPDKNLIEISVYKDSSL